MSLKLNTAGALAQLQEEIGRRLLAAAVLFQTQHRLRLNRSNPRPYKDSSKIGEYPRARAGFGRDNVDYEPATTAGIVAEGFKVRIGYRANAFYMAVLEIKHQRLGLQKTFADLQPQIRALLEKPL